jgi:8-oxo-dGTP diphosphatase
LRKSKEARDKACSTTSYKVTVTNKDVIKSGISQQTETSCQAGHSILILYNDSNRLTKERSMLLATLCYVKSNGQTLMIYRNRKANDMHEGKWNGLGGKFEAGETPEECVIREVLEESGLTIQNPKLCGLLMFPNFKGNDWYVFVFIATELSGELIDSLEGKLEWIPDDKVLTLSLWESDHIFMPWIRETKFFSAKFIYEADQMKGYEVVFH